MVASNLRCSCLSIPILSQHFHSFVLQTFMACVEHSRPRKYRNRQSTAFTLRNLSPSRLLGKSLVKVLCCEGKWAEQLQFCSGTFDSVLSGENTCLESTVPGTIHAVSLSSQTHPWKPSHGWGAQRWRVAGSICLAPDFIFLLAPVALGSRSDQGQTVWRGKPTCLDKCHTPVIHESAETFGAKANFWHC